MEAQNPFHPYILLMISLATDSLSLKPNAPGRAPPIGFSKIQRQIPGYPGIRMQIGGGTPQNQFHPIISLKIRSRHRGADPAWRLKRPICRCGNVRQRDFGTSSIGAFFNKS